MAPATQTNTMSHPDPQPETHGAGHHSQTPQVAVRVGNRLICPCCGEVLMVIPDRPIEEMTVYQMGLPASQPTKGDPRPYYPCIQRMIAKQEAEERGEQNTSKEEPPPLPASLPVIDDGPHYCADVIAVAIDPEVAARVFPDVPPPRVPRISMRKRDHAKEYAARAPRDRPANARFREQQLRRMKLPPGEPITYKLARLYAWTYYRLQKLDRQLEGEIRAKEEEIERLQRELDAKTRDASVDNVPPQRETPATTSQAGELQTATQHAQADLGVAPGELVGTSSGELIGVSTGESSNTPTIEDASQASSANERGPP